MIRLVRKQIEDIVMQSFESTIDEGNNTRWSSQILLIALLIWCMIVYTRAARVKSVPTMYVGRLVEVARLLPMTDMSIPHAYINTNTYIRTYIHTK